MAKPKIRKKSADCVDYTDYLQSSNAAGEIKEPSLAARFSLAHDGSPISNRNLRNLCNLRIVMLFD
jgi:hypothetical protein